MAAAWLLVVLLAPDDLQTLQGALEKAVAGKSWGQVEAAAKAIAKIPGDDAREVLQEQLWLASEQPHARAVFRALAFRKDGETREFLNSYLEEEEPYYRAVCLEAYEKLEPETAVARAAELLATDPDKRVRLQCARILARSSDPRAARALIRGAARLPAAEQEPALALLEGMDTGALLGLRPYLKDPDRDKRLFVLRLFVARNDERLRPALKEASRSRDRATSFVALAGLDRLEGPKHPSTLRRLAEQSKSVSERWELYEAVIRARVRDPALARFLAAEARAGDKRLRPKAAEALGYAGGAQAVTALASLLVAAKPWQLPIGAARGLAGTRAKEAIPPLIRGVKQSRGRLQHEIAKALESLTGQPFGRLAKSWEKWWKERSTGFQVPKTAPALWEHETAAGSRHQRYAFYGVEIYSEAVVFVCDISGSMQGAPIAQLKKELSYVLKRFPPGGRFNLVFFETKVHPWAGRLCKATADVRARALRFVEAQQTTGATNLWGGLQAGLQDKSVDTIVLLTDGSPTAGEVQDMGEIRRRFLKLNRARMIELHVIALGVDNAYLRDMARASGGTYASKRVR